MAKTHSAALAVPILCALGMFLMVGCESDRMSNIPPSATVSASGNMQLTFTAPQSGTVWVYDVNSDRIIYSGPIGANQSVVVDPSANQITLDGRVVFDKGLNGGDQNRIYFEAMAQ